MSSALNSFITQYLPQVESELQRVVEQARLPRDSTLYEMLAYHMGWAGEGAGVKVSGKRIRPLMVLLGNTAAGGDWRSAIPAAAAVELIHNFSLIHDDIEDNSPTRRNRPTLWKLWGIQQAINAGDTMFTLAHLASLRLLETSPLQAAIKAFPVIHRTCLQLTQGQYLDMAYETRADLEMEDYWIMVSGKTAALFSACMALGAITAQADKGRCTAYERFGEKLGLAFQVLDDWLGIWGDAQVTGKPTASDILEGKKTLPILFGLKQNRAFTNRWLQIMSNRKLLTGSSSTSSGDRITTQEVVELAHLLEVEGGKDFTQKAADRLTQEALQALEKAHPQGQAADALHELACQLLKRDT